MDALDRVPVELELANDYGGKVNPTGVQLLERHRLLASVPQSLEHPQLLSFNERHRPDPSPHSPVAHHHRVSHALAAPAGFEAGTCEPAFHALRRSAYPAD
jgi:hypothetical protein